MFEFFVVLAKGFNFQTKGYWFGSLCVYLAVDMTF